jgi:hypothetical protein
MCLHPTRRRRPTIIRKANVDKCSHPTLRIAGLPNLTPYAGPVLFVSDDGHNETRLHRSSHLHRHHGRAGWKVCRHLRKERMWLCW